MFPSIENKSIETANIPKAALTLLGALFLYTAQDVIIKSLPSNYHVFEIIFFRCLFFFIPIFFFSFMEQGHFKSPLPLLKTQHLKAQIFRALLMFIALVFYFLACRSIPLASLYTLSYTSPLFMTILSVPFLNEKVGIYRLSAVIVGFVGVFIILQPGSDTFQISALYAVISGLFIAASIICGKRLCAKDSNTLLVLIYTIVCSLGALIALPFVWITPSFDFILGCLAAGVLGGSAHFGFVHAFRLAPVSALAPFDYCGLIWATLAGYVFWHDIPNLYTIIGAFFIISMGLFTLYREKKLKLKLSS